MLTIKPADLETVEAAAALLERIAGDVLDMVEIRAEAKETAEALAGVAAFVRQYTAPADLLDEARQVALAVEDEEDRISLDDVASMSPSDGGTFVSAWLWVPGDEDDDSDLAEAAEGETCTACERPSIECSRAPCSAVMEDRGDLPAVPDDFEVRPIAFMSDEYHETRARDALAQCGNCSRMWDDSIATSYTPAPAGRCPFEYFHADAD